MLSKQSRIFKRRQSERTGRAKKRRVLAAQPSVLLNGPGNEKRNNDDSNLEGGVRLGSATA
jgi:hypothetical protein